MDIAGIIALVFIVATAVVIYRGWKGREWTPEELAEAEERRKAAAAKIAEIRTALETGVNPDTGEPLTDIERAQLIFIFRRMTGQI